ncbi:MAG: glycosyltransferase family 2 protein, partial [Kofleriaceae bacterium]|nr:glycosyltransferase family 2 protein [Kofleriaceae bacterium]
MTALLIASALLVSALTLYSLAHYLCAAVFLFSPSKKRSFDGDPMDAVSVLVPARNEGESALRALASLVEQDHSGPRTLYLLIKDSADSCIALLARRHPDILFDVPAPNTIELPEREGCVTMVVYTGMDPKSDKINYMVSQLSTPYLAILDADHQARPDWIRTSLCLLHEKNARIIQGTRGPLVAHGFFPMWDSLHQHIGCEVFN